MPNYIALSYLPSRFVPYSKEDVKIKIRPLYFEEAESVSLIKGRPLAILELLYESEAVKVENMDFFDLTYDDWRFIELTISNLSFPAVKFNITAGECPDCKDSPEVITISMNGQDKEIVVKPELKAVVIPSEIAFTELDEEIIPPIVPVLSNKEYNLDFYRLKHFKILSESKSNKEVDKYKLLLDNNDIRFSFEDIQVLRYLDEKMFHGPKNEFEVKCKQCGKVYKVSSVWEVADFLPFRISEDNIRNRVSFGKRTKSANNFSKKVRIHKSI